MSDGREAGAGAPSGDEAEGETAALVALVDELSRTLDRGDLVELEVEVGGTGIVLRKPAAFAPATAAAVAAPGVAAAGGQATETAPAQAEAPTIKAPLTGIFYTAPAPGSAPYVTVGSQVAVGQVIGLIEAMKLFNEIKSDLAGRVVRIVAEGGTLVKARQPLIEVEAL
ncbi:MAG TPA: acetyl-CoA carboxylase [Candidatus Limnocylindrales bacterium]|nr:acetyl-CoA carboxylase [Candidatus Limnocylindrales bacterium]